MKPRSNTITRVRTWLQGAAVALDLFRASRKPREQPAEVPRTGEQDPRYEPQHYTDEAELLAAYRVADGVVNDVEDAAAARELVSSGYDGEGEGFQLAQALTSMLYPMGMEGYVRGVMEAQRQATAMRRVYAEAWRENSRFAPGLQQIAVLSRGQCLQHRFAWEESTAP